MMYQGTDLTVFDIFAKGKVSLKARTSNNCVIYTRVSTKEQADNNLSLETQRKACNQYAEKCGYTVLANFGGTYESAQTDERKEFSAMLSYVKKSRETISFIIVYSLERFSRNDNSIWLSGQLRKLGIEIVSVTQPIDTSNPSGQLQQKMMFLFGEFDNQLRRQKCMAGIKDMLLAGEWPTKPPLGYDTVKVNNKRRIIINQKGKLLQLAFHWKAEENVTLEVIRQRLAERGLNLCHQRVCEILRNPFYCGMMVHNMLEGKVVKGNHPPLITHDLFLKVNGLLARNTHGYQINEENKEIPLKRFVCCDECNKPFRGYIVKSKNVYYYKCNTKGCRNNKSARSLNDTFAKILSYFSIDAAMESIHLIKQQTIVIFNQLTDGSKNEYQLLQQQCTDLTRKIERLEERYIEGEIDAELYGRFAAKFKAEKKQAEDNLLKASQQVSNLEECIDLAIEFASKLPSRWLSANYHTKQQLQFF